VGLWGKWDFNTPSLINRDFLPFKGVGDMNHLIFIWVLCLKQGKG
jgi:hypothetical protein